MQQVAVVRSTAGCIGSQGTRVSGCEQPLPAYRFRQTPDPTPGHLSLRASLPASSGFTLVEMLIVMAIIMTISAMAVPSLQAAIDDAKVAAAVADIRELENEIVLYQIEHGALPNALADIGRDTLLDPWGRPYQYLNFATVKGKGKMRKDRFLVPLNSDYDLYSVGKDGQSVPPITAKSSQDDVLRANDGSFIGLASAY